MRPSWRLLATAMTGNGLRPAPMALLPPIPLYRRLFRAHRKHLPPEMRLLGDEYIKAEFRAHRNVDNPAHLIGFLTEWQLYAQKVEGDSWVGEKLDQEKVEKMSGSLWPESFRMSNLLTIIHQDQQIGQLYELMKAISKRHDEGNE
ncbi:hypothetical protein AAE478_000103 [Parahypoxylon ruwenzoriense]